MLLCTRYVCAVNLISHDIKIEQNRYFTSQEYIGTRTARCVVVRDNMRGKYIAPGQYVRKLRKDEVKNGLIDTITVT